MKLKNGILSTEDMEGFHIVRAMASHKIPPVKTVHRRNTTLYYSILLDDNNRKSISRLRSNTSHKYIGVLDQEIKKLNTLLERL